MSSTKHVVRPSSASLQTDAEFATALATGAGVCDVVTCSYSLTMIPDWRRAVDMAYLLLREKGNMAVADFLSWKQASRASQFTWRNWARHVTLKTSYASTGTGTLGCVVLLSLFSS
jgi:hypothetical protein